MKNIMVSYIILSCDANTTLPGQNMGVYFIQKYITHQNTFYAMYTLSLSVLIVVSVLQKMFFNDK